MIRRVLLKDEKDQVGREQLQAVAIFSSNIKWELEEVTPQEGGETWTMQKKRDNLVRTVCALHYQGRKEKNHRTIRKGPNAP